SIYCSKPFLPFSQLVGQNDRCELFLAKSACKTVRKWLQQKSKQCPFSGYDGSLNRHARVKLNLPHFSELNLAWRTFRLQAPQSGPEACSARPWHQHRQALRALVPLERSHAGARERRRGGPDPTQTKKDSCQYNPSADIGLNRPILWGLAV